MIIYNEPKLLMETPFLQSFPRTYEFAQTSANDLAFALNKDA